VHVAVQCVRGTRSCCVWQSIALKLLLLLMLLFFSLFSPNFRTPVQIGKETIKFSLSNFPNRPEEDAAAAAEGYCRCCSLQLHFIQELFCGSRNPPPLPRELWSLLVLVVVLLFHETQ
jgi:hypothetical protein